MATEEPQRYSEVAFCETLAEVVRRIPDIEAVETIVDSERLAPNELIAYVDSRWAGPKALRIIVEPVSEEDLRGQ